MILFAEIPVNNKSAYINVYLRERKGLKRVTMSFSTKERHLVLSVPSKTPQKFLHTFIQTHHDWIEQQVQRHGTESKKFTAGTIVLFKGKNYTLVHEVSNKVLVCCEADTLFVRAAQTRVDTHVRRWLMKHVTELCNEFSLKFAKVLGVSINKISVKAMHTRWGSCSSDGNLNYNWRLIMAPEEILIYVCAHEVSHLVYMNHSKEFWGTVKRLHPNFETARAWLKKNGANLYVFG
ncbi:MAG: SprT family zinc-dependent metalloprotease [Candidatus Paracaedibacteraceae bacterium]|nr:SprT family zinc-dependent metalloprotease [Candidatus Paracaedibacteraceae bacterium]